MPNYINSSFIPDPDRGLYSAGILGKNGNEASIQDNGWLFDSWFPLYYSSTEILDNWTDALYVGNAGAPFNIGNEREGWVYQANLRWIYISPIVGSGRPFNKPIYFWMNPKSGQSNEEDFKGWYFIKKDYFVFNGIFKANGGTTNWFNNPPSDCTSNEGLIVYAFTNFSAGQYNTTEFRGLTIDSQGTVYVYRPSTQAWVTLF